MNEPQSGAPYHLRPVPLLKRADFVCQAMEFQQIPHVMLKDPIELKYHNLNPERYYLWSLLDGTRSLETLQRELQRQFPSTSLSLEEIQYELQSFAENGLVRSDRPGQEVTFRKKKLKSQWDKSKQTVQNFLFLRLPGWNPQAFLTQVYPWIRWCFTPAVLLPGVALVIWSWVFLLINFDTFMAQQPGFQQFFAWPNLAWVFVLMAAVKVLHELGHGFTCHHFRKECHEMGVMLLVFTPTLYCDVTDSWMLPSKWQRIAIAIAGVYVELVLSALGLFLWWRTGEGLLHNLALNLFWLGFVSTVVFNLNPLIRFDGYYIFSDLLEIPNLRQKADRLLLEKFASFFFGITMPEDKLMPHRRKGWFVLYSVGCWVYKWVLIFGIGWYLYQFLKPYGLQNLTFFMISLSVIFMGVNFGKGLKKILQTPRENPIKWIRAAVLFGLLFALLGSLLLYPFKHRITAPFLLQPTDAMHLALQTDGQLEELLVSDGQPVKAGQLLARFSNWELEDKLRRVELQQKVQASKLKVARELKDDAAETLILEQLAGLAEQEQELKLQQKHLEIRAPVAGTIYSPPEIEEQPLDHSDGRLPRWSGSPLDPENLGGFFQRGTQLFVLAPHPTWEAIILIEQDRRNDLSLDAKVQLRLDARTNQTFVSQVETISREPMETLPPRMSNKAGGYFATVTNSQGEEELTVPVFQVRVPIPASASLLENRLRGRARIEADRRSLLSRGWRLMRQTFYLEL